MKKIMIIVLAVLLLFVVSACDQANQSVVEEEAAVTEKVIVETENEQQKSAEVALYESAVSLETIRSEMIDSLSVEEPFLLETDALLGLYGISADMVAQSASFVTMSGTFPDEIILVEAVDSAAADAVEELLCNRLNEVLVQSQTYDAENYAAAQMCQVWRNDLFVALILSPDQQALAECYLGFFE